jgi:hypothetical protein
VTPEQKTPLIVVSRLAAAALRQDAEQVALIDAEISAVSVEYWRTIALCACAEYATEVAEHRGDAAHEWLLRRIEHDLG